MEYQVRKGDVMQGAAFMSTIQIALTRLIMFPPLRLRLRMMWRIDIRRLLQRLSPLGMSLYLV